MAETTTISNLPQITLDELTNDTLVPVENVDGTKAANLAQLRKKLNSLYVEMADADLNELKQDGIYECWGTTLNAPTSEVAAWIIQTAEHGGVVVQNAFGLGTTSYSYVYRRRWNGVAWTAWENRVLSLEERVSALESGSSSLDAAEVGDIKAIAYDTPQAGWLPCNGAAYSRTTYSRLYSRIGTKWGAGDGSTTFNVPNFVNKTVWQRADNQVGITTAGELPNITGEVKIDHAIVYNATGCFTADSPIVQNYGGTPETNPTRLLMNASKSSSFYKDVNLVVPANNSIIFCIRY